MQITEHIHALKIPFQVPVALDRAVPRFVYSYFVTGSRLCRVDSGVASAAPLVLEEIGRHGHEPADLSLLVLTHGHPDHIGAAEAIRAATGCTVAAHPAEKDWIEDVAIQFEQRPVPGFHSLVGGSVMIDHQLEDGEILDLGEQALHVLHTPGHSPGSVSLFSPGEAVLFAGDAIPQPGDLPVYEDVLASIGSLKKLRQLKDVQILLSSWADPIQGEQIEQVVNTGLGYLQAIHDAVRDISKEAEVTDLMTLCAKVVGKMGLPSFAANPLVARSLASHLPLRDCQNLIG